MTRFFESQSKAMAMCTMHDSKPSAFMRCVSLCLTVSRCNIYIFLSPALTRLDISYKWPTFKGPRPSAVMSRPSVPRSSSVTFSEESPISLSHACALAEWLSCQTADMKVLGSSAMHCMKELSRSSFNPCFTPPRSIVYLASGKLTCGTC